MCCSGINHKLVSSLLPSHFKTRYEEFITPVVLPFETRRQNVGNAGLLDLTLCAASLFSLPKFKCMVYGIRNNIGFFGL